MTTLKTVAAVLAIAFMFGWPALILGYHTWRGQ